MPRIVKDFFNLRPILRFLGVRLALCSFCSTYLRPLAASQQRVCKMFPQSELDDEPSMLEGPLRAAGQITDLTI